MPGLELGNKELTFIGFRLVADGDSSSAPLAVVAIDLIKAGRPLPNDLVTDLPLVY